MNVRTPEQERGAVEVAAFVKHDSPLPGHTVFMNYEPWMDDGLSPGWIPLMTVAQHERILAAWQRTQAAGVPDWYRLVPVDLLERTICRLTHGHEHDKAVRELRALLTANQQEATGHEQ